MELGVRVITTATEPAASLTEKSDGENTTVATVVGNRGHVWVPLRSNSAYIHSTVMGMKSSAARFCLKNTKISIR